MKLATDEFDRISKALADPQRRAILQKLAMTGKLNCSDVHAYFDVSQPTVSHHLKVLRDAELVTVSRRGVWAYYAATDEGRWVLDQVSAAVRKEAVATG